MKKQLLVIPLITFFSFLPTVAFAQDLVPATSEDIEAFEQQLMKQREGRDKIQKDKKEKDNFGSAVAAEAKKLKEESKESKKEFGKWVSEQRRKNDDNRPDATGAIDNSGKGRGAKDSSVGSDVRGKDKSDTTADGAAPGRGRGRNKDK